MDYQFSIWNGQSMVYGLWFMVYGFNSLRGYYLKWPKYGLWFMVYGFNS